MNYDTTKDIVETMNQECEFGGYQMLQPTDNMDDDYDTGRPDMFYEYDASGNVALEGMFFPYPYDGTDRLLTKLVVYSTEYSVYGLRVGDDISDIQDVLTGYGYAEVKKSDSYYWFEQADLIITIHPSEDSKISHIIISVIDPNKPADDAVY